jgi:hypothetical protein
MNSPRVAGFFMRGRMSDMVCEHLKALDETLTAAGVQVVYRDRQPWAKDCRNWTRYAVAFDIAAVRERFNFDDCVVDWEVDDHWQGSERGFVCNQHNDAIIGDFYPSKELRRPLGQTKLPRWSAHWTLPIVGSVLFVVTIVFAIVMRLSR